MDIEKVCRICGARFLAHKSDAVYCSQECRREAGTQKPYIKNDGMVRCMICKKDFIPQTCVQRYCSPECLREANNRQKRERARRKRAEFKYQNRKRSIDDIVRAAEAEGLSYGQYVIREKMRNESHYRS